MNITFMIGNGFDRNLGLATTYSEFVKEYKNTPAATDILKNFRAHIKDNEELWSAAEVALGLYTKELGAGEGEAFAECHMDICEALAKYLKYEQERIDYELFSEQAYKAILSLNDITKPFPTQERSVLNDLFARRINENRHFYFINFNYTDTLDRLIAVAGTNPDVLGSHSYSNVVMHHKIGGTCHVHGTVDGEMVFGVNDDTQISKNEIFECENGDLYKELLIKQSANATYLENTDARAAKILSESQIIYIYGMSIGDTDRLWWERVCEWLAANSDHHLIFQKYEMPEKRVLPIKYQLAERSARKEITRNCNFDDDVKRRIEARIHVTSDNIFEGIRCIAARG